MCEWILGFFRLLDAHSVTSVKNRDEPESSLVIPSGHSKKRIASWKSNSLENWEVVFFLYNQAQCIWFPVDDLKIEKKNIPVLLGYIFFFCLFLGT